MRRIRLGLKKKKKGGGGEEESSVWGGGGEGGREFRLDSNDFGFSCAGVSNVVSYKRNVWYYLSCLLQIYCRLSIIEKLLATFSTVSTLADSFSRHLA